MSHEERLLVPVPIFGRFLRPCCLEEDTECAFLESAIRSMTDLEAKILGPVAGAPPRVRIRYRGEPPSENWAQQLSFWIYPKLGIPWIGRLCGFLQEPCVLYVAPFPDRAWREIARSTVCNGSTPQLDRVTLGVMHAHSAYRRTFHLIT